MDDDCNTPRALGVVFETVREANRALDAGQLDTLQEIRQGLATLGNVMGLLQESPEDFLQRVKEEGLTGVSFAPEDIEQLIADRAAARKARDFRRADEIRDQLQAQGILLKDSPTGTSWTIDG
jgi:cysteinyl-tRNA synthetase